jgi:TPR repeat protein
MDQIKAVQWYKKAARRSDPKAYYNIGLCYKRGEGVRQSNKWAMYYFNKAVALGHKEASKQLKELLRSKHFL